MKFPSRTIERVFPSGAWRISWTEAGHLRTEQYIGYNKRDAIGTWMDARRQEAKR